MNTINIDDNSGFCWGVVQTIDKVEDCLKKYADKQVYVLGEIIHNPHEIARLAKKNLKTISYKQLSEISSDNSVVVVRAHGEPPTTYNKINELGIELVDATCPLVKRLQEKISKYYSKNYQIIIFGKYNHSEVVGLRGFCNDECIVILEFDELIDKLDFSQKTVLCSQTTMDVEALNTIHKKISEEFLKNNFADNFIFENTICKFVINREEKLREFAKMNEAILFVAGHHSSNGKVLFDICKTENPNSYFIENFEEIDFRKIETACKIGITGATSTPKWFLEEMKKQVKNHSCPNNFS